jgi:hypothetical protein
MIRWFAYILVLLGLAASLRAEPQYSVIFGQNCFLCHVNPTGGGMRSSYGSQFFAPEYLPKWTLSDSVLAKVKPQLSSSVSIGADIRTIWMSESKPFETDPSTGLSKPFSTNTGTNALMQGNLYFAFQPTDRLSFQYTHDLVNASRFEAFGSAHVLPLHGYVKVGQFRENYGWNLSDHTAFVRTGLWEGYDGNPYGSPTPPNYGVGAEIGFLPQPFNVTASFSDAAGQTPGPMDVQKHWTARAMVQKGIPGLNLEFSAGGSYMHAPPMGGDSTKQRRWGGFGGIGWQGMPGIMGCNAGFGFLTSALMFEYDRKAWQPLSQSSPVTSAYATAQLSTMIQPGIWLLGAYDWLDNSGLKDGNEAERTSLGVQFFPWPWVDITPMYRLYTPSPVAGPARNIRHVEVQAHFLF